MNENIREALAHEVDALAQVVADSRCSSELIGIRIRNSWAEIGPKLLHAANMWDAAQRAALPLVGVEREQRQQVVVEWGARCFGVEHMADKIVRAARFFEEAAELVQAVGLSRDHALRAFDHVYGRSAGEPWQEAGGVGVTLMALCNALGLSADDCEVKEIARCLSKSPESFAARNVAKIEQVDAPALPAQLVGERIKPMATPESRREAETLNALALRLFEQWESAFRPQNGYALPEKSAFMAGVIAAEIAAGRTPPDRRREPSSSAASPQPREGDVRP